jgi:hypothetical protein
VSLPILSNTRLSTPKYTTLNIGHTSITSLFNQLSLTHETNARNAYVIIGAQIRPEILIILSSYDLFHLAAIFLG